MKGIKKLLTGILAATLALTMNVTAFATETEPAEQISVGTVSVGEGEGSITVASAVADEVYSLYKIFDFEAATNADGTKSKTEGVYTIKSDSPWYGFVTSDTAKAYVKVTTEGGKNYVAWVNTDTTNSVTGNDETAIAAFAKAAYEYAKNVAPTAQVKADKKNNAKFTGVDYGYYMVGSSVGAIVGINTATPDATIKEKNGQPTSEKQVEEDSTGKLGDKDDADIGQTVNFQSTVTIPAGGALNVVFEDEMTASLTLKADSIKVYDKDNKEITSSVVKENGISTSKVLFENEKEGALLHDKFTVAFKDDVTSALKEATTYTIKYSAVLNENAVVRDENSTQGEFGTGNDNHSRITYGNNGHTEWDWTRTYTYPIKLKKVNEQGKVLPGAVFTIARATAENDILALVEISKGDKDTAAIYRLPMEGERNTVTEMTTPESGLITISGLDADAYVLTETKAPEGYNLLKDPITVTIKSNTAPTNVGQTDISVVYTSSSAIKDDNAEGTYTGTLDILNLTGTLLPSTGGIGTTIFYIIGGILIVAGVAYFILRRKADAE
ncbi:SpaA isopeptide-forming pilin-related protein [Butyrivibrio sp. FCS014]|uniref:SpaA isopeptide-forming pilin-related protein n=1 Tax=Butyrivibrio sp. FCS014 TaxID=1408304 RepID=UPI000463D79D|nr:SpaA isopeptide-forming pilin-related protein [Butyrivibrio sp. FCS014]